MYRIDIGQLEKLRVSTEALKKAMQESAEKVGTEAAGLETCWEGEAAEETIAAGNILTQDMLLTAAYLELLEGVLTGTEEQALYLKARCQSLEAVMEEEITTVGVYINTEEEKEGVLTLDEELTEKIVKNCTDATENAIQIEKELREIEELIGSLRYTRIDISRPAEGIRAACKKIKQMEEYGRVYADYAEKIQELDACINNGLSEYLPEEKISAEIYEPALWAGNLNITRILYLMENGSGGLSEEEKKELEYALDYIKDGKDKNGTTLLLYEYLCMCGEERELTDIEKEYLAWGAVQLELVLLSLYGSEEERYEKVLTLLEKEEWTEEEKIYISTELECYTSGGETEKISAITEKLLTGSYEERETGYGEATYYVIGTESDKITALSGTCSSMGYTNAARFLGAVGETGNRNIEADMGEGKTGSYHIEYCTAEDGVITLGLVMEVHGGEEGEGKWQEITFGHDMGVALLSDEEVVNKYESMDNYNVIERWFSEERRDDYTYKQMLESRYQGIKLAEAEAVVTEYDLTEDLEVLYGSSATEEEKEQAQEKIERLAEAGIETGWLENYYQYTESEERIEAARDLAEEHAFISSMYSVPLKLGGGGMAALYQMGCYLSGTPINTESHWYTSLRQAEEIRATVSEDMGEAGQIAYHATMGILDYGAANIVTCGHGGILMAVQGYGESGYEAAQRGLSPDDIQIMGWTGVASNLATDRLIGRAFRGCNGLLGSVAEGSIGAGVEWYMTDTVDGFVSGDLSRRDITYREYLAAGMSPEEANETAFNARKEELLYEMAVGGTMSGEAWGLGRPIAAIRFVYNQVQGISTPVTSESTRPLQEEGISEILDVGDGVLLDEGGKTSTITNKFSDEAMPHDGTILDYYIENGRIKGIEGRRNVDFVITADNRLLIGNKHHYLGNGQDVLAAGQLKINGKGQIKRIDNLSGHYRPTVGEAMGYQSLFESQGLDLNKTWLEYHRIDIDADGFVVGTSIDYIKMIGGK